MGGECFAGCSGWSGLFDADKAEKMAKEEKQGYHHGATFYQAG